MVKSPNTTNVAADPLRVHMRSASNDKDEVPASYWRLLTESADEREIVKVEEVCALKIAAALNLKFPFE
jgi:hypothetical protein